MDLVSNPIKRRLAVVQLGDMINLNHGCLSDHMRSDLWVSEDVSLRGTREDEENLHNLRFPFLPFAGCHTAV